MEVHSTVETVFSQGHVEDELSMSRNPNSNELTRLGSVSLLLKTLYAVRYRVLASGFLRLVNTAIQILPSLLVR